jgi:AcrB/AcrD/AcrF family
MNLVSFALRRPISLLTMVVAIALVGFLAVDRMSRDIFPDLGVPTIYVAQPYGGLDPAQMEGFIVNYYEYHFLYITGIEHVESKSIQGVALIKLQFHPGTDMAQALAETVSYVDRARLHADRDRPAVRGPVRCRWRAGRRPRVLQQDENSRRASGRGALQGAPLVRDLARRVGTAALRLEPAHHPRPRRSRQAAFLQHVAGRGGAGVGCRQHGQPIG